VASYRAIFDLHPWFTQSRWALGRGRITRGGAMRLIVTTIVAAMALHLAGVSLAQLASLSVRLAAEWPVAAIVVMLLAFGTSTTRALLALRRTLRQGWLAGLPIAEVRITFALVLVALARVYERRGHRRRLGRVEHRDRDHAAPEQHHRDAGCRRTVHHARGIAGGGSPAACVVFDAADADARRSARIARAGDDRRTRVRATGWTAFR
jgi:hypothetical protein